MSDPVLDRISDALDLFNAGRRSEARDGFAAIWSDIEIDGDPFHQCVLSHYTAGAQDDPHQEVAWNRRALDAANRIGRERPDAASLSVLSLYPSLHLNLADALHRTGDAFELVILARIDFPRAELEVDVVEVDAAMLLFSAAILRGIVVDERRTPRADAHFWRDLRAGVRFVRSQRLLVALACAVGVWQMCHHAALVVQILVATRTLGLSEQAIGLSYTGMGLGTVLGSVWGDRISRRIGPGRCLTLGFAVCGTGWGLLALAPTGRLGIAAFALMLLMFGAGAVLVFINFLALRQAVTPEPLLGRMTSTMRWLILIPAGPGALLGGWLGEHVGLRASLAFAGGTALLLALVASRVAVIRDLRELPATEHHDERIGAESAGITAQTTT